MPDPADIIATQSNDAIANAFSSVFVRPGCWRWSFAPSIDSAMVFYPSGVEVLSVQQFDLLTEFRRARDDTVAFVSTIEQVETYSEIAEHWALRFPTYMEYKDAMIALENAIYGSSGRWGIVLSNEGFGVLGADRVTIRYFREHYRDWAEQERAFRRDFTAERYSSAAEEIVPSSFTAFD